MLSHRESISKNVCYNGWFVHEFINKNEKNVTWICGGVKYNFLRLWVQLVDGFLCWILRGGCSVWKSIRMGTYLKLPQIGYNPNDAFHAHAQDSVGIQGMSRICA